MSMEISKEQLRQALSGDFERLLDEVVEAVSKAKPGHIIDDSEEPVRDAAGAIPPHAVREGPGASQSRRSFFPLWTPQTAEALSGETKGHKRFTPSRSMARSRFADGSGGPIRRGAVRRWMIGWD